MAAITVSRQYGSGGSAIAKAIAERLKWELIDNEFIDLVAQRAGLSHEEVEQREERGPSLVERLAQALAVSTPELLVAPGEPPATGPPSEADLVKITEAVIHEVVQHGHVVLVGRGASAYLGKSERTLHVFVVAPHGLRVQRVAERLGLSAKEAERTLDRFDEGRRQYARTYYGRRWDDPSQYHLIVNTEFFSYDEAAELVVETARHRGW